MRRAQDMGSDGTGAGGEKKNGGMGATEVNELNAHVVERKRGGIRGEFEACVSGKNGDMCSDGMGDGEETQEGKEA